MHRRLLVFAGIFALSALSGLPALAQAPKVKVKVSVPFTFWIGHHPLPPDDYLFSASDETVIVQKANGQTAAILLANRLSGKDAGSTGRVVFECYVEECFVSKVWIAGLDEGWRVLSSPRERRVARRTPGVYMALLGRQ